MASFQYLRIMILLFCFCFLAVAQEWSSPIKLYETSDTIQFSVWHQYKTQQNHFFITDGYSGDKISFHYHLPTITESPILIDNFGPGYIFYGSFITGTENATRIAAIYSLQDRQSRKIRLFVKESKNGGLTWENDRIEIGDSNDTYSRRRPGAVYISKTGRLWIFYIREDDNYNQICAVTKPGDSDFFGPEIVLDKNAKLATNIESSSDLKNPEKITIEYRKWLSTDTIATYLLLTKSGGIKWESREILRENFKTNITFFAEFSDSENPFIGSTFIDYSYENDNTDYNKTIKSSFNLGKTWEHGLSLIPGYVRGVSLAACKSNSHDNEYLFGIYAKEHNEVMFSKYHTNPWTQIPMPIPPAGEIEQISTTKLICGQTQGKYTFVALTTIIKKPNTALYMNIIETD